MSSAAKSAILLRCPKCCKGRLYKSLLKVDYKCKECDFPIANHDAADGPAYIAMSISSVVITVAALYVDHVFTPAYWIHLAVWIPAIFILSILLLIWAKSFMISMEYKHNIGEFDGE